ncbi:MAG: glycosyltransferase family 4 protein, partial [Bacteroidales bacterium]
SGIKSVVTIHDLIFLRYPEYYKPIDRLIYKYKFRRACQKADRIIAVSEMTKRDIVSFFEIPAEKIDVVYQGCDNSFKTPVSEQFKSTIRSIYGLPEKYILSVGTIEARKNLLLAVKALKETGKKYHLVALGKPTPYLNKVKEFVEENGMEDQVTFLHNVPFAHLPAIYQSASLFVYPSFFEGFGIPIIEALHSGIPVIGATGSCLEEAGGAHSAYVDPNDPKEMARLMEDILNDPIRQRWMIQKGLEHVSKFEEENIAIELQEVYSKLVEKK